MHQTTGAEHREHKTAQLLRADARVKLFVLFSALLLVVSARGVVLPVFVLALSLGLMVWLRVSLKSVALRFIEPALIVLVIIIFKSLTGTEEFLRLYGISFYREGLSEGLHMALRIAAAVAAVAAVTFSSPVADLLSALQWMRVPSTLIEVALFAYRYIAGFHDEARVIYSSQRGRLGYVGVQRSLGSVGMMCGSLMMRALEQAESTALAMKQRGYDGQMPRHHFEPFRYSEVAAGLALCLLMLALWWLR